jgi:flagellar hook-basal body complex protein FliE
MTTIPSLAAGAYAATQGLAQPASAGAASPIGGAAAPKSFADTLTDLLGNAADAGRKSDQQAAMAAAGKGDLVDVVTAVAETETALETLVAVRDRVIQAYEEIMRMPV